MKPFQLTYLCVLFAALALVACAELPLVPRNEFPGADDQLAEHHLTLARDYLDQGELRRAITHLRIVRRVSPDPDELDREIRLLETEAQSRVADHLESGRRHLAEHETAAARQAFLAALHCDPENTEALAALRHLVKMDREIRYTIQPGDTPERIADAVYQNPALDVVVARLADPDRLEPGRDLNLPAFDLPIRNAPAQEAAVDLSRADNLLKNARYDEALQVVDRVLKQDPKHAEAAELKDTIYYQWGEELLRRHDLIGAVEKFRRVSPGHPNVSALLAGLSSEIEGLAQLHYQKGVNHFVNENLTEAIAEWEKTLMLDPDHEKARSDIRNARNLLEKLKQLEKEAE